MLVAHVFESGGCKNRLSIVNMLLLVPLKLHEGIPVTEALHEVTLQLVVTPPIFDGSFITTLES